MTQFCSSRPAVLAVLVLAAGLAGCSDNTRKTFGLEANPPNAFEVGTQPPLALPPELGQLPPPNPGQAPTQEANPAQEGANIVSPQPAPAPVSGTPGEQALLNSAGPTPPAGISAEVNQNALIASKPPGFVGQLMGNGPKPPATVDAPAEAQRLQQNQALGQPVTKGTTPQESPQPGLWGQFLNLF